MTTWIGLTGGIGSGKSQAAACFSALGIPIIDADAINRKIIDTPNHSALTQIKQYFGEHAITETGCLNRTHIRELIFKQPKAKQQLESILHPYIINDIRKQQTHFPKAIYGIVEIPTLTEHPHFQNLIQRVLLIQCSESERIKRVQQRSHLSENTIRAIINNQASDAQRIAIADDVIDNSSNLYALKQQIEKQHQIYCQLYAPQISVQTSQQVR